MAASSYAYLQVLRLNFFPSRRHDCSLSLHWHRQVSGLRGWFLGHSAAHTQPHSSSSHRWPVGHNFPSPWPSHRHTPERREGLTRTENKTSIRYGITHIWLWSGFGLLQQIFAALLPESYLCLSLMAGFCLVAFRMTALLWCLYSKFETKASSYREIGIALTTHYHTFVNAQKTDQCSHTVQH